MRGRKGPSPFRGRGGGSLLVALALLGCRSKAPPSPARASTSRPLPISFKELGPDASPGERATLRLGAPPTDKRGALTAMEFEVGVKRSVEGREVVLKLIAGGEVLEREAYESGAGAFRIVSTGEDAFAPPLDLLRFAPKEGASWEWRGKVVYAGVSREARAGVSVRGEGEDVRSDVALVVTSKEGVERKRSFAFWFRKGRGVVARCFGDVSSRRPLGEPWRP